MATEEQVKDFAHSIWEHEGCPEGTHYFRAKQILEEKATNAIVLGPSSPIIQLAALPSKRKSSARRKRRG